MKFVVLALRNLSRQKRRTFMLAAAIAFGVFIVTVVNGFSAGAVRILKENVADLLGGHVFIEQEQIIDEDVRSIMKDETAILEVLTEMGIKDTQLTRSVGTQGTLVFGPQSQVTRVNGLRWESSDLQIERLGLDAEARELVATNPRALVISKKAADELKIQRGEELDFKTETWTGQQNVGTFIVAWITDDSSDFAAFTSYGDSRYVSELLNLPSPDSYRTLRVKLSRLEEADLFALRLKTAMEAKGLVLKAEEEAGAAAALNFTNPVFKIGGEETVFDGTRWTVESVNDLLSEVNQVSGGLAFASLIVLVVLLIITMIGISNTFRMILYERTIEIGTMRALGMQRPAVSGVLLWEALFLSLGGLVLGVVLAGIAMFILGFINFGSDSILAIFLQNGRLNFVIDFGTTAVSAILVSVFSLLAAQGPARKAARLEPAEALRTAN